MIETKQKRRLIIEVTHEQKQQLTKHLAYGEQRRVLTAILNDVCTMLDEFGHDFVIFILEREFSYRTQMVKYNEDKRSGDTEARRANTGRTAVADAHGPREAPAGTGETYERADEEDDGEWIEEERY